MILLTVGKVGYIPLAVAPVVTAVLLDRRWTRRVSFLTWAAVIAFGCWLAWAAIIHAEVFSIRPGVTIDPAAQARWIAVHSAAFARVLFGLAHWNWPMLTLAVFGYRIGWTTVPVPWWVGPVSAAAIVVTTVGAGGVRKAASASYAIAALTMICALGIVVLLYLQYNAVGAKRLEGVQGRYFLPVVIVFAPWFPRTRPMPRLTEGAAALAALVTGGYFVFFGPPWWSA